MSAASPTSEVAVCNLALGRIGQAPISSIDAPSTPAEDKVAQWYPVTRRALLRDGTYNFSKELAQLTVSGDETPTFGFASAFALPNDFIRLLTLGDYTIGGNVPVPRYDIVGNFLYTDFEDDTDTLNIKYVKDATDVRKWDSLFLNLMWLTLAKNLAMPFALKPSLVKSIDDDIAVVEMKAKAVSGQEKPPQRIQRSRLVQARRLGRSGFRGDTSRYEI